jgi:hypothetical protein
MSISLILWILFAHFVADFVFQDESWAINKSTSLLALLKHILVYTLMMSMFMAFVLTPNNLGIFFLITFFTHGIIDYFTSKIVKKKFDRKEFGSPIPNLGAFTTIGFDQWLHYACLFISIKVLM